MKRALSPSLAVRALVLAAGSFYPGRMSQPCR